MVSDYFSCSSILTEYKIVTLPVSRFAAVGLLPEQPDGPQSPFPVSRLEAQYREKRSVLIRPVQLHEVVLNMRRRLRLAESTGVYGRPRLMVDALCDDIGPELVTNFQVLKFLDVLLSMSGVYRGRFF